MKSAVMYNRTQKSPSYRHKPHPKLLIPHNLLPRRKRLISFDLTQGKPLGPEQLYSSFSLTDEKVFMGEKYGIHSIPSKLLQCLVVNASTLCVRRLHC
ncbi:hypothetical protein TNIN_112961 [Trichonephila inaurata madagascariensis]|uniref:Uncharacterized protein n=1 Tax=Trichonephila inaurata madagascariensis TaxID=2747483 RepID=A0A8X7CUY8_9ARAC|nr:hypothetical protein TNIN_112961 [Trichonephila inaurata madagascariensis]